MPFSLSIHVLSFIAAFALSIFLGPIVIPILRRLKFGQTVRDDGPSTHLKKTGTPTIGGIIFLLPIFIISYYFSSDYPEIMPLALVTVGFGAVGFIDDFVKVVKKRKDGLYPRQKTVGLLLVAAAFTYYIVYIYKLGTDIIIPFAGVDLTYNIPTWLFIPFTIIVFYATTNSVNMTDGVDGLAVGVTLIVMIFFTIVSMTRAEWNSMTMFSSIVSGGCLGFLAFNIHPAKVFMGDTGSLALGGAVAALSVMMKMPWIIIVIGVVYVLESLSVIIQVTSFKLTGKRVFKMAPLHHHFELLGWKETKVVRVFWIITVIACLIGFGMLRFRFY